MYSIRELAYLKKMTIYEGIKQQEEICAGH